MSKTGIAKQMAWLMTGLIGLTIGGVGMQAYLLSSANRDARESEARLIERSRQQSGLVRELVAVQTLAQKVVRERDPDELEKAVERYKAMDEAAQKVVKQMGAAQVAAALDRLREVNGRILESVLSGDNADAARLLIEEGGPRSGELMAVLNDTQQAWAKASEEESKKEGERRAALNKVAVGAALVLAMVMGFAAAMVVRRLRGQLQEAMERLSQGADQMTNATSQISSVSQSLASSASEQVAAMEKTTGATKELHSEIHDNSVKSRDAAELMGKTSAAVDDADARLGEMTSAMQAIAASSGKISQIIRTIDEIAFQTNILALNAAVEAARAGEAGMGFAVVADEVRNLAQRAAQAARDTTGLIEESLAHSKEGTGKFQLVEASTRAISESATQAKRLVDDVQASGGAQTRSIDEISRALSEIESLTQHTATSAEESAAAAEQLSAQAEELRHVVRGIEELVG